MASNNCDTIESLKDEAEQLQQKLFEERKKLDDAESMLKLAIF